MPVHITSVQTVYVETEWNPQDLIGETRFIEQLAARYGVPNAVVAQAWLDHPDAIAVLAEQARLQVRAQRAPQTGRADRHRRSSGTCAA